MAKRKTSKRHYRMITFKVFEDTDSDILDWWEGIDEGERSDALRDLIRGYLGKQPRRNKLLTIPELLEVRQDTLWIRDALNEMPRLSGTAGSACDREQRDGDCHAADREITDHWRCPTNV
jgi:hypothetical protein